MQFDFRLEVGSHGKGKRSEEMDAPQKKMIIVIFIFKIGRGETGKNKVNQSNGSPRIQKRRALNIYLFLTKGTGKIPQQDKQMSNKFCFCLRSNHWVLSFFCKLQRVRTHSSVLKIDLYYLKWGRLTATCACAFFVCMWLLLSRTISGLCDNVNHCPPRLSSLLPFSRFGLRVKNHLRNK